MSDRPSTCKPAAPSSTTSKDTSAPKFLITRPRVATSEDGCRRIDVCATFPNGKMKDITLEHKDGDQLGKGTFGQVIRAKLASNGESVAIKTIHQQHISQNRELEFLLRLDHPNVTKLYFYYFTSDDSGLDDDDDEDQKNCGKADIYLHLGLELMPETVHALSMRYYKQGLYVPVCAIKLIMYQLFRALAFLGYQGLVHRDVKPQNILMDVKSGIVKLCDLGSMKRLVKGERNVSYVVSRHYRAPEVLCASETYDCAIDIWAAGCTFAELILQKPLFPGSNTADQLAKIFRILGTPSDKTITQFCEEAKVVDKALRALDPAVQPVNLSSILPVHVPLEAVTLLTQLLQLVPSKRMGFIEAMQHKWFDELRDPTKMLRKDVPLPPLFNFNEIELAYMLPPQKETAASPTARIIQAESAYNSQATTPQANPSAQNSSIQLLLNLAKKPSSSSSGVSPEANLTQDVCSPPQEACASSQDTQQSSQPANSVIQPPQHGCAEALEGSCATNSIPTNDQEKNDGKHSKIASNDNSSSNMHSSCSTLSNQQSGQEQIQETDQSRKSSTDRASSSTVVSAASTSTQQSDRQQLGRRSTSYDNIKVIEYTTEV